MRWQDRFRQARAEWMLLTLYERFEQVVVRFLNERPVWGAASNTISGRDGRETDEVLVEVSSSGGRAPSAHQWLTATEESVLGFASPWCVRVWALPPSITLT